MSATTNATPRDDQPKTVAFAADYISVSRGQIYGLCEAGKLRHFRLPGTGARATIRIPFGALREFVESSAVPPEAK